MSTQTLLGGKEFEVTRLDGTKAKVFVRQIPIREMHKYLEFQDHEPEMIELVCKMKPEIVDSLSYESHAALVAEIERVNEDFFTAWGKRQKARAEKLKAAFTQSAEPPSPSPTSPPNVPLSAA